MAPGVDTQAQPQAPHEKNANGNGAVDRVKANEMAEDKIAGRLGAQDMYISAEKDTDWYHCMFSLTIALALTFGLLSPSAVVVKAPPTINQPNNHTNFKTQGPAPSTSSPTASRTAAVHT